MKKIIYVFLLFLLVISACNQNPYKREGNPEVQQPESQPPQTTEPQQIQEPLVGQVGIFVKASDVAYQVVRVKDVKRVGTSQVGKNADGVYILLDMMIQNDGTIPKTIDHSMFYLVDNQKRIYSDDWADATNLVNMDRTDIYLEAIQPGVAFKGSLLFDVPKDVEGLQLAIVENPQGQGPIILIDLGSKVKVMAPEKKLVSWDEYFAECQKKFPPDQFKVFKEKFTDQCEKEYASDFKLVEWCDKVKDYALQDECYMNVAIAKQDGEICNHFFTRENVVKCLRNVEYAKNKY